MNYTITTERIKKDGEEIVRYVNSMHNFMTNLKHVAHMSQEELDDKDMVERAQAASRGIIDNTIRIEKIILEFQEKYGKGHEDLI
jgi:hypothetical protein